MGFPGEQYTTLPCACGENTRGSVIRSGRRANTGPADDSLEGTAMRSKRVMGIMLVLIPSMLIQTETVGAHGNQVDDGKGGVDLNDLSHKSMIVRLQSRQPGTYTVKWKAVSSPDQEVTQGSFRFTVGSSQVEPLPPLAIVTPKTGATVQSPVIVVFKTPADLSMMTVAEHGMAMGPHLHVELDGRVTMPTFKQVTRLNPTTYQVNVGPAKPGAHAIRVYWASTDHKPISPVQVVTALVR